VSQARPIIPASVSQFRPIRSRPTADKCKPLQLAVRLGSFDGHPWPWLPINVLRRQMANRHSFVVVIGPIRVMCSHYLPTAGKTQSGLSGRVVSAFDQERDAHASL